MFQAFRKCVTIRFSIALIKANFNKKRLSLITKTKADRQK